MTTSDPTVMLIQAVAQRDADNFAAKMADSSLGGRRGHLAAPHRSTQSQPGSAGPAGAGRRARRRGRDQGRPADPGRAAEEGRARRTAGRGRGDRSRSDVHRGRRRARDDPTRRQRTDPSLPGRRPQPTPAERRHEPRRSTGRSPRGDRHRGGILHRRGGAADRTGRCGRQAREADRLGAPARRPAAPGRRWRYRAGAGLAGRRCVRLLCRLRGRVEHGGRRAARTGAGAAGDPRVGTARQADGGLDADAWSRRATGFRRDPRRAATVAGRRLDRGGRGSRSNSAAGCASGTRRWAPCPPPAAQPRPRSSTTTSCGRAQRGAAPSCRHRARCPRGCSPRCGSNPRGVRRRPRWSRSSSAPMYWCAWRSSARSWPRPGC